MNTRESFKTTGIVVLLLMCCITLHSKAADDSGAVSFGNDKLLMDLRQTDWEYLEKDPSWTNKVAGFGRSAADMKRDAESAKVECETVSKAEGWKPIRVGRRWENLGHPELNDKVTWLKLKFHVPAEMKSYRLGFFCTAVDDAADFYLNGTHLVRKMYVWGARVPEPVNIDLTSQLHFGGENLLMIRVNDSAQARGGGILGNVLLYRTLPFERTSRGGITLASGPTGAFSVVLHLGDALLTKGQQSAFTGTELSSMEVPPYILRDDELVLVFPSEIAGKAAGSHRVQLDEVCPTRDERPLAVRCDKLPTRVEQFELLTIPVELAAAYDNAFDPRQINVQAVLETPSGKTEKVAAFFWQDFTSVAIGEDEEILLPRKCNPWRLYYRPRETGIHKFHILAQDKTGVSRTPDQKFEVTTSNRKGFLRVSRNDPRFFEFDNGESYFGIGPSGWFRDANYIFGGNPRHVSTRRLDEYYRRKAEAGSNYDYCLAEFFGRLYTQGGYIDQHVAWKCEHRLRLLEELGIYWVTCYDDLCRSTCYGLDTMPYSAAQGGPCRSIAELYVNERALEMQRDHLRYFVGRMSDSPALLVWSIGDEGQAGSGFSHLMVRSWIKELQNYVRTIDVYQHPHIMCEGPRSIADGGDAIIIPDWYFHRDVDAVTLSLELDQKYGKFNCPLINPEGGMVEWTKPADSYGPKRALYYLTGERWTFPEAISFHNHLWISLFLKNAVGGTEWMGAFIVQRNQMCHASAIRNYLAGESLTKLHWEMTKPEVSHADLRGFCLQSDGKSLVWIQNRYYNWLEAGHQGKVPPGIKDARITIPVKKDGNYRIELWDTRSGNVTATSTAQSTDKAVSYALPSIDKDVAMKLILVEQK
ncbi:MAG: hypothetical protein A2283_04030 [Lentisphaerae bacterium RIFOXYA12_FULL_48_11]|nr:MAG: hypothetical protein A2283_04030 [Lentisphaerae bacterium RIFOXYA12_FULL_48_11]